MISHTYEVYEYLFIIQKMYFYVGLHIERNIHRITQVVTLHIQITASVASCHVVNFVLTPLHPPSKFKIQGWFIIIYMHVLFENFPRP